MNEKKKLIGEYNLPQNCNGEYVNVILGTDVVKEGLNFHHIQKIHILTPHWNFSKTEQIIGRGIRYRSHDSLKYNLIQKNSFKSWFNSSSYKDNQTILDIVN